MAKLPMQGTLLLHGAVPVAQRVSLDGPEFSRAEVSTTDLDTVAWKDYRPSLLADPGEISGTLYYDPKDASHQALFTSLVTSAVDAWTFQFSDGSKYVLNGFLSKFKPGDGVEQGDEDNLKATFTMRCSGAPAFTAAAP